MASTRPHQSVVQSKQQGTLRRQFQVVVVVLSCYFVLLLSPNLIINIYLSAVPVPDAHQLSPLSVPSVISTEQQLVVFFCRFLFHVYVAGKLFVFSASSSAFRQSLLLLVTCSCCGTRHLDVIVRWCGAHRDIFKPLAPLAVRAVDFQEVHSDSRFESNRFDSLNESIRPFGFPKIGPFDSTTTCWSLHMQSLSTLTVCTFYAGIIHLVFS